MLPTDDVSGAFEASDETEYDILTGDDAAEEEVVIEQPASPAGVVLDKDALAELIASKSQAGNMNAGFEKLVEQLSQRGPANVAPVQDDFDPAKIEEDLWKPGKAAETIQKVAARMAAQQTGQTALASQEMEKRLMKLDPDTSEIFKKYEKEIEQRVQSLPPQFRFQPNVYSQVYRAITQEKQSEIIQDKAATMAQAIAEKAVAEALEKAGVGKPRQSGTAMQTEVGSGAPPRPKTVLRLTSWDVAQMEESGMNHKDPDQVKSYLNWKKSKGIK